MNPSQHEDLLPITVKTSLRPRSCSSHASPDEKERASPELEGTDSTFLHCGLQALAAACAAGAAD